MSHESNFAAYADTQGTIYVLDRNVGDGLQSLLTLALAKERGNLVRAVEHSAEQIRLKDLPHDPPPGHTRFRVPGFPEEDKDEAIRLAQDFHQKIQAQINHLEGH